MKKINIFFSMILLSGIGTHVLAYVPDVGPGECKAGCDALEYDGSSDYGYDASSYSGAAEAGARLGEAIRAQFEAAAEAQRIAAQQRVQALQLNSSGNRAFSTGLWDDAIVYYEQALALTPWDQVIQDNLRRARAAKINEQGIEFHRVQDWPNAIAAYKQALAFSPEDRVIRKNLTLAERMQGMQKEERLEHNIAVAYQSIQPILEQVLTGIKPAHAAPPILLAKQRELPITKFEWDKTDPKDLKVASNPPTGTAQGAGEHGKSAAYHADKIRRVMKERPVNPAEDFDTAAEVLKHEGGNVFDSAGRYSGTLRKPEIRAEGMGKEALVIPDSRMQDPSVAPLADKWNRIDREHGALERRYESLKDKADKTPMDYVDMAKMKGELSQIEYNKNLLKREWERKLAEPPIPPVADAKTEKPNPPSPPMQENEAKKKRVVVIR